MKNKKIAKSKKTITKACLVFSLVLLLASCAKKEDYVGNIALVDGVPISKDLYSTQLDYYQKYYTKIYGDDYLDTEVERGETHNDILQKELVDSMIKDQVMLNNLEANQVKIDDSKATSLRQDLEKKLAGKDSLKANMNAMGLSENQFNENLYRDSIRKIHYDYYLTHNDIKDSEILDYYRKNSKYQRMYKYNVLVFDDKNEADKTRSIINSPADFKKHLKKPVKNYDLINSDFVYEDDDLLVKSKVKETDEISDVFTSDDKYMILMVNSYNENENELLIKLKDIYLEDNYEDYLNKLIKRAKIKLFV